MPLATRIIYFLLISILPLALLLLNFDLIIQNLFKFMKSSNEQKKF